MPIISTGSNVDKLTIANEMAQFDRKNRDFYDSLTDEERKKFSNYLMIRWGSSVQGNAFEQSVYLLSCNENLNKHFFSISKHPKLQWLCATTVSPNWGTYKHQWIAPKKKDAGSNEVKKQLMELYPNMKTADIEALAALTTKQELKQHLREHGQSD